MLNKSKELNNMTIRIETTGGFELQASECPKCQAPTLDQTSNREDCDNCGYWLIYATGEGWGGYRDEEK
jgi:ribosomal protein S27AE